MSMKAVGVISGDSLVLRGRPGPQGQPPKERILHLADISSPRLGNVSREDEPWAYEARDFLRALVVGKEITFTSSHQLPPGEGDIPRDLGNGEVNGREPTEDDLRRKGLESEAKSTGRGLWNPHGPKARQVIHNMPLDSQGFINEWKGKQMDAIVESVRDGTTLRGEHQFVNITLAGARSPRTAVKQGESSEPLGDEAKYFTESRLLQRAVKVQLLSLPTVTATPFQTNGSNTPAPASIFIGIVLHPVGNIAEFVLGAGLAHFVEWHSGMLAPYGGSEKLRSADRAAKEKRLGLHANASTPSAISKSISGTANGTARAFEGTVIRVWSGDQVSIATKDGKERRLQLSSTRGPKLSDPKQAFYAQEAREFLRKKLIGKHVRVHVDFIRPREGEYEERESATVRVGNQNGVVRHKRDDEDRSPDYDKLMAAEQTAAAEGRGIHSGKEQPAPRPPLNLSEASNRAAQFLNGFKRLGRIPAVVDYVATGSRFKIFLPKDNQVLTLVLGGIRAPRTARSASEKNEPYGTEAAEFATRRYMQRDVEIEIETTDKSGGFIGALYLKNENAAVTLVSEGLATVHSFSADTLPWAKQLYDTEDEAKKARRNIWSDYDEAAAKQVEAESEEDHGARKPEYRDVIVSDVRTKNGFSFSVQILNTEGITSLAQLMRDFSTYHKATAPSPGFVPRAAILSRRSSLMIRRASPVKREAEVTFIDYGNQDTIGFTDIRPLDPKFRTLPGQAHDARLSFVKLVDENSEYREDAVDRFRQLCEGRTLVANIDHKEGSTLHLRLIDPANPASVEDSLASINVDLVREGLASVDRKGCKYLASYPQVLKKLQEAIAGAKRDRFGMFEFGDVEEDE
ncbi:transcription factor [Multifurca ochricompacta]|uniref:Transcription factor n=1 Tax=Multifurca ochricompacta TaxID=376703 RepID=A0AAD4M9L0_9AGAM|nr:transcription factor [Multifurca ochricompacta]